MQHVCQQINAVYCSHARNIIPYAMLHSPIFSHLNHFSPSFMRYIRKIYKYFEYFTNCESQHAAVFAQSTNRLEGRCLDKVGIASVMDSKKVSHLKWLGSEWETLHLYEEHFCPWQNHFTHILIILSVHMKRSYVTGWWNNRHIYCIWRTEGDRHDKFNWILKIKRMIQKFIR